METKDLTALAVERVSKARQELILDQTFYGVLVSQVESVPSRQVPTMATDGRRHYFNPEFIGTLSQKELLGVQAHETEHDARRHHTRRGGRDPQEWNICCDYAINIDLIDAGFTLPSDALIDEKYRGMSAEDIYRTRELDRQQQQPQPQPGDSDEGDGDDDAGDDDADENDAGDEGDADDEGNEAGEAGDEAGDDDAGDEGKGQADGDEGDADDGKGSGAGDEAGEPGEGSGDGEAAEGDGTGEGSGQASGEPTGEPGDEAGSEGKGPQSSGDPGRCGEVLDAAVDDAAELADQDARWERVLRQAASLAAKRGDAPGHVSREIERSDHPPQDWRETLRAFFDGGAASQETWTRPNRRFIGGGLYLPGREREGINRAVFLIDTSGSMDQVALEAIGVEAQAALDEHVIDELVIIYGDTRVTRVDTYRLGDEIEFDPRGGGGTVLRPLFEHAEKNFEASLIVCFTDGYTDITSESPEPACPVLWAFTGYPDAVREHIANAPWGAAGIDVGSH